MAPRVVVRQAQGSVAASAVGTVPGARSVQRQWQAAKPGSATSGPAMSAAGLISGHRRGTTDGGDDVAPRPTRPAAPLPGAAVNGGGPSASDGGSPSTAAGVDVDRLIEAIEERVLAEVERRGGRYTGLF